MRIPVGVQQAGFGGEQQPGAIDVDRSAFQHHLDRKTPQAQRPADSGRNPVVARERRVFSPPGVVAPVRHRYFAGPQIPDENRPVVAAPAIISRMIEKFDVAQLGFGPVDQQAGAALQWPHQVDPHFFKSADQRDQFGEPGGNWTKMPWPGRPLMRPRQPDRLLRLPLGRHAKAQRGRGGIARGGSDRLCGLNHDQIS